jgi:DNA repair protein RecO (recombination protein O)
MNSAVRVELEFAYVLHARSYRETSQLLEVFTPGHGRVGLLARGSRRPKSPFRGLLNPFQPLRLSWSGRGELGSLRQVELAGIASAPSGNLLMAGFYVNELILKLLQRNDPHPGLFTHYASLIGRMTDRDEVEKGLRRFELELLREIGYELNLSHEAVTHAPLTAAQCYEFHVEQGPVGVTHEVRGDMCFTGRELLAIGQQDFADKETLLAAKRLLRTTLDFHLGGKNLQTRRIAGAMKH